MVSPYLSIDSPMIRAYGFVDNHIDIESSFLKHEKSSSYFFIPQIELDEYERGSVLAATLAWDDSSICTFEKAIHSLESSLYQVICYSSAEDICHNKCMGSAPKKSDVVPDKNLQMIYINAHSFIPKHKEADHSQMEGASASSQFSFMLSPTIVVSTNMV
ncbi:hypothetical protein GIB67_007204 [Kingdonia uniflora]|uniref:Uncharacterized protein n=1 Tax=Kingdonia uniflora TaxID=39325 RepID=A0A7J7NX71_9MAGN|nr:hypothetical protein GIB67_007204 [Kingdonia uniflora]